MNIRLVIDGSTCFFMSDVSEDLRSKIQCVIDGKVYDISANRSMTLLELRPGAVFVTNDGVYAVKSEYRYDSSPRSQCECVLLESGEYAHFKDGNQTIVSEVSLGSLKSEHSTQPLAPPLQGQEVFDTLSTGELRATLKSLKDNFVKGADHCASIASTHKGTSKYTLMVPDIASASGWESMAIAVDRVAMALGITLEEPE